MRTEIINQVSSFPLSSLPFVGQHFTSQDVEGLAAEPRTVGSEFIKARQTVLEAVASRDQLPAEAQRRAVAFLRWAADSIEKIEIPAKSAAEAGETADVAVQAEQAGDAAAQPAA